MFKIKVSAGLVLLEAQRADLGASLLASGGFRQSLGSSGCRHITPVIVPILSSACPWVSVSQISLFLKRDQSLRGICPGSWG